MAVSYFPSSGRSESPLPVADNALKHHLNEGVQEAYVEHKHSLLNAVDSTKSILDDLRKFNKDTWVVRYPQLHEQPVDAETPKSNKRRNLRRSLSFPDDPAFQAEVVVSPARKGLTRSVTLASIADEDESNTQTEDDGDRLVSLSEASDFHVFRLDLKLGAHGSSNSPAALVSQLEKPPSRTCWTIASSEQSITSTSFVFSTFVNALLRREIMPVDQQPCTTAFCEVHDASENEGKEEVHLLKEGVSYSTKDESTFTRASLSDLDAIVSENENEQQVLRVYLTDPRDPRESLLNNGVVDISLIDAPGLNRDNTHTTRVFARQEEIDVVVFVVSAENHFTLSAKEFLINASNEKAYLFIVVNKGPRALCRFFDGPPLRDTAFDNLESSLRSFVLVKRLKSKLTPASTYVNKLLSDVDLLVGANAIVAQTELDRALDDLNKARPVLEKMTNGRETLEESLESVEELGASRTSMRTKELLADALERVGLGKLGVDKSSVSMPSYPGLLGIWDYARDVRRALLASLDAAVKLAEDEARIATTNAVNKISQLGEEHLPEGVERSRRVFMPEAMFSMRAGDKRANRKSKRMSGAIVAGGAYGLGVGLAQRADMLETTFLDMFDVHHQFWMHFGDGKSEDDEESAVSTLGFASVGLGALTMVGGKALGARGVIEGSSVYGSYSRTRRLASGLRPSSALSLSVSLHISSWSSQHNPKTVGRRVKVSLLKEAEEKGEEGSFVGGNAVRERFRAAMDERGREVQGAEEMEKKSRKALDWFVEVGKRSGEVRSLVELACSA
ncbi:Transmembrane GTPase fzo1 [Grifola frondosa]|uniref:Transmembrane GTPase fzo1 n=1 Tax=Grifola frondosa TaxID=5627 RepID=A0A1C7M3P0_GRIFR|nr:Transmembrane GTPase fzo1 [Grifola frondosa]